MFIINALNDADRVLNQFISNKVNISNIESAVNLMVDSFNHNGRIFSCGNGGSMCDAMHFSEELSGRFRKERPSLPAMAISDPSHISCVANDYGYEYIFSKYLEAWAQPSDVLLAISTSGNSKNVIEAIKIAKQKGMKVIGLSGKGGGTLKSMVDIAFIVDSDVSDRIQEIHIKCIHIFIEGIERKLFPENYTDHSLVSK